MSNIIVVGCGRVGSQLATMLSDNDNNVSCIDVNPDSFQNLGRSFNGSTIQGFGFDEDVLIRAGIEDCDVLAAVTQYDTTNFMCAEVASKMFGVPRVITRLYNPEHERTYLQLGLDFVCGTSLVAEEIFAKVTAHHGWHVASFGQYEILEFSLTIPEGMGKKSVRVSDIERNHELSIVAFERADGSISSIPSKDSVLYNGDTVLACVSQDSMATLEEYVKGKSDTAVALDAKALAANYGDDAKEDDDDAPLEKGAACV